jgi:N-acylglucosamine 2-epimerase
MAGTEMRRRAFFGVGLESAAIATGLSGCAETGTGDTADMAGPGTSLIGSIGGMSLEQLREQYRYDLFDDFLDFFNTHIVDHEIGGFMCSANHDGSLRSTEKRTWYLGRGSWCYSYLYNKIDKDDRHLDTASKAIDLIMKHRPSGDDYWPGTLTKEGEVSNPNGGLSGDCYIAEGLAEYSKATGERKYFELAKETMDKCWRLYMRPDFNDSTCPFPGAKNLWYWMLFMWFGTNMLDVEPDPALEARTAACVDAIMNHHQNPAFDLMNNHINHDLSRAEDPRNSELAACGHATEALWMIMYEAIRTGDSALFELAAKRFRRHVEVSWDDVYGGVFNDCRNVDENVWQLTKIHWAEVFVLMGSLPVIEHTNAAWAHDWFSRQNTWIRENFLLKPHGHQMWKGTTDRKATYNPEPSSVKDLYHHPRHLMLNLLCLDRMIERGGTISGLIDVPSSS